MEMDEEGLFEGHLGGPLLKVVTKHVQDSDFYPSYLQAVQNRLESYDCSSPQAFKKSLENVLKEPELQWQLTNTVYHYFQRNPHIKSPEQPLANHKEPLDYIRKAQLSWEKRICKSLNSICVELCIALARKRPVSEQKELEAKWHELSTQELDLSQFRPVYAAKDFLDVLVSLRSPNYRGFDDLRYGIYWGTIQVPLLSRDINSLKEVFHQFSEHKYHLGIGEGLLELDSWREYRMNLGKQVIRHNYTLLAREFCKSGCPQSLRAAIWSQILDVNITDKEKLYYDQLKTFVFQHDLMIDKLIYKDVKLTASNDDQYFVFQDYLHQVMLLFSRDTAVLHHFNHSSSSPPKALLRGKLEVDEVTVVYPPSGVIPFHGFSMYAAPLCFLFDDPVPLYFVFREFYTRYFFRLHSVTSNQQGIVCLSLLFERLLQSHEEELCDHFRQHRIEPLRVAFRWLMRAFSGHLTADQVLLLWDTILAYDSLECLTVLAVGIICFRKRSLLQVHSQAESEAILADLSSIKVIPILTAFLTREDAGFI